MKKNENKFNEKELNKMCAIGRAASKLFAKKGYIETTLQDISTAAKLSKGGIYHYFSNKHEILYFTFDNYMDLLFGKLVEELKEIPDNSAKIQFIMSRHLKLYNKKVPEAKALLFYAHNLPLKYFRAIAEKQKKYAQILIDVLADFFDNRAEMDKLKAVSYTLFGMCNSIIYWYDPKGPISPDELSDICCEIFMNGISGYRNNIKTL